MSLQSKHPLWMDRVDEWRRCRDVHEGEAKVKDKGKEYLRPTSGMIEDGCESPEQPGWKAYDAYRHRARMPDMYREAVDALVGVMHREPAIINLPSRMEFLRERATARGEDLQALLRRINEEQMKIGRLGLLADVVDEGRGERSGQPYVAIYEAEDVGNWDDGRRDGIEVDNLNLVIIDETGPERLTDFEWRDVEKYRVLMLSPPGQLGVQITSQEVSNEVVGDDSSVMNLPVGEGVYNVGVFREDTFSPSEMKAPSISGRELNEIPFVFVNPKDLDADPDVPPMLGLCDDVLGIYRSEADYRQALFMQGQDTLHIADTNFGAETPVRTGAGAKIVTQSDGSVQFVGVDSSGLPEMRTGLENDYARAEQKGAKLLRQMGNDAESGEALRVRVAAQTATLSLIARTGAAAVQRILRIIARWMGENANEVTVEPSLKFAEQAIEGRTVVDFTTAKNAGAPLSHETIHEYYQDHNVTALSWEEELGRLRAEASNGTNEIVEGMGGSGEADPEPENPEPQPNPEPNSDPEA
ncbi:MAG: DUF4055 domain-containing protein [Proteobacteria bacterium]|nr:DUF4055 domain-containing protein [Pseudomonadota bacterium]